MANRRSNLDLTTYVHDENRGQWANKTEYVLTIIGYAVGISAVVRFPYLVYRSGGGAFLIPYFLMLFLCGIPLFYMEICIGQFSSTSCVGMYRLAPLFKGGSIALIVINLLTAIYYSLWIAYPIRYLWAFTSKELAFTSCGNSWNTDACRIFDDIKYVQGEDQKFKTPGDEYFHNEVLQITEGPHQIGTIVWPLLLSLFITWAIIYVCIFKGLDSVGKAVYFTAIFPYVVLIIFLVRGATLDGAAEGVKFYINPDWSKLGDFRIWTDAAVQIFLSLGPGWGGIVNMASFTKLHNNVRVDAFMLPLINVGTSVLAGFFVFSILGFLSKQSGVPISKVANSGLGLAYITYPEAIARLPIPHIWGILFFLMLLFLGIDSVFVQIECVMGILMDAFPAIRTKKRYVTLIVCILCFLVSIFLTTEGGMYYVALTDWYLATPTLIAICMLELIMTFYNYGVDRFMLDIHFMTGKKVHFLWKYIWKYVTLVFLVIVTVAVFAYNRRITYNGVEYPDWAVGIGWTLAALAFCPIPFYMIYVFASRGGTCKEKFHASMEITDWTPATDDDRKDYDKFLREQEILMLEEQKQKAELKAKKRREKEELKAKKQAEKEALKAKKQTEKEALKNRQK